MVIPDKVLLFFIPLIVIERYLYSFTSVVGPFSWCCWLALVYYSLLPSLAKVEWVVEILNSFCARLGAWTKLTLLAFFLATLVGAVYGMIGMIVGRFKKRQQLPFGPFIAIGALLSYFYGDSIIDGICRFCDV